MTERSSCRCESAARGQLSISVVEAAIGVLFLFAATATFALGVPDAGAEEAQLDQYAQDAATVLSQEPPRHAGATRLSEVSRSESAFERERDALERRVERILPDNLMFRVVTPHGAVGFRRPTDTPSGRATVPTLSGRVAIWVWYA
ncbi:hypothetical protein [Halolamina sp.]|uniref:DUF7262 family protein n=1 Tax=Halolamina sp. TaxID=1940283 RepID=UPI000223BCDD|nr:hypothetical protein Halar_3138 [halophilic archaeon DL31]